MSTFRDLAHPWVEGLTAYEPGRPIEEVARELGFADVEEIVKLASNENPLGPSPRALRAMRAAAPRMHIYPDGDAFALREALARKWGVAPDQLLATNGSNEAIELLGHVFLGPGRSIVMADHAFVIYRLVAASLQAQVISAPMRHLRHDVDALLAAITPATRLVFIDNPDNIVKRHPAYYPFFEILYYLVAALQRPDPYPVDRPAVIFGNNDIVSHVHQFPREVAGIRGF